MVYYIYNMIPPIAAFVVAEAARAERTKKLKEMNPFYGKGHVWSDYKTMRMLDDKPANGSEIGLKIACSLCFIVLVIVCIVLWETLT